MYFFCFTREFKAKKNNVRNQIYSTISKVTGTLVSSADILVTYHAIFDEEKSRDESRCLRRDYGYSEDRNKRTICFGYKRSLCKKKFKQF